MTNCEIADLEGDIRNLATLITVTSNLAINVQISGSSDEDRASMEEIQSMLWIARDLADHLKSTVRSLAGGQP